MVQPKTLATWFHIAEHQEYAAQQKYDMMVSSGQVAQPGQPTPTNNNKQRSSPTEAAAPLKQEMQTSMQ